MARAAGREEGGIRRSPAAAEVRSGRRAGTAAAAASAALGGGGASSAAGAGWPVGAGLAPAAAGGGVGWRRRRRRRRGRGLGRARGRDRCEERLLLGVRALGEKGRRDGVALGGGQILRRRRHVGEVGIGGVGAGDRGAFLGDRAALDVVVPIDRIDRCRGRGAAGEEQETKRPRCRRSAGPQPRPGLNRSLVPTRFRAVADHGFATAPETPRAAMVM